MSGNDQDQASFGFRDVPLGERQKLVNEVFRSVAERYDLMNDLMSGGLHRLWKDDLVNWLAPSETRPMRLLDVAGGTGDVAFRFCSASRGSADGPDAIVCDLSPEMVGVGRRRADERGLASRVGFVVGNAEALPFPDRSFDAYTIAFGIRNVVPAPGAVRGHDPRRRIRARIISQSDRRDCCHTFRMEALISVPAELPLNAA